MKKPYALRDGSRFGPKVNLTQCQSETFHNYRTERCPNHIKVNDLEELENVFEVPWSI